MGFFSLFGSIGPATQAEWGIQDQNQVPLYFTERPSLKERQRQGVTVTSGDIREGETMSFYIANGSGKFVKISLEPRTVRYFELPAGSASRISFQFSGWNEGAGLAPCIRLYLTQINVYLASEKF